VASWAFDPASGDSIVKQSVGYSRLQITLHWLVVLGIILQLLLNEPIQDAYDARLDNEPGERNPLVLVHVAVGVAILLMAVARLVLRFTHGVPPQHKDKPAVLNWVARATHVLLYAFIIGMPLTGAVAWFGLVEPAGDLHELGRPLLIAVVLLHVAGAFAEQFVFRNDTLRRMLVPESR
jgi:cytochrome b561